MGQPLEGNIFRPSLVWDAYIELVHNERMDSF